MIKLKVLVKNQDDQQEYLLIPMGHLIQNRTLVHSYKKKKE